VQSLSNTTDEPKPYSLAAENLYKYTIQIISMVFHIQVNFPNDPDILPPEIRGRRVAVAYSASCAIEAYIKGGPRTGNVELIGRAARIAATTLQSDYM
jgi:hypothetical protein